MAGTAFNFPTYTHAERAADRLIHIIGVPAGLAAGAWLLIQSIGHSPGFIASIAIYAGGLALMLCASAAYQLAPAGLAKERLRRLDRAAIFIMIAGTYTPISANVLNGRGGITLCVILWSMAAAGIYLTLRYPRRFERAIFGLYLAMGWMLVILIRNAYAALTAGTLAFLLAGGLAYTVGAIIHTQSRLKFHNPIWHALILLAAGLQYAAIAGQLGL